MQALEISNTFWASIPHVRGVQLVNLNRLLGIYKMDQTRTLDDSRQTPVFQLVLDFDAEDKGYILEYRERLERDRVYEILEETLLTGFTKGYPAVFTIPGE